MTREVSAIKSPTTMPPAPRSVAIYCRKSTQEGLDQAFNSLDAQREAGEAFIRSQRHEGWLLSAERYDDGGYTGGNLDRPAMQRLIADIQACKIGGVVVYKIDRLSRSLLDFAKLLELFERHNVAFVSVTQQFNTATPMGRLLLNVLLSFAQFEREQIAERTRDKMSATRRKGKFCGGRAVLGYDVVDRRLIVNEAEAAQVRTIFELYRRYGGLLPVVVELNARGWKNKRTTTKDGRSVGGRAFDKASLHQLLRNPVYTGRVRHKGEVFPGEQSAIVDAELFAAVQQLLARHGRTGGKEVRNRFGALLKGLLFCKCCGGAMTPSHAKRGSKRYRYYRCATAQMRGSAACRVRPIPAGEIERFVVDRIRAIGCDEALIRQVIAEARAQLAAMITALEVEERRLERELLRRHGEVRQLLAHTPAAGDGSPTLATMVDLQTEIQRDERRLNEVRTQLGAVPTLDAPAAAAALAAFDPVWQALSPAERTRVVQLLIERVEYDAAAGRIAITFRPQGIQALERELAAAAGEARA
jgi:site-specific DNA recombinase